MEILGFLIIIICLFPEKWVLALDRDTISFHFQIINASTSNIRDYALSVEALSSDLTNPSLSKRQKKVLCQEIPPHIDTLLSYRHSSFDDEERKVHLLKVIDATYQLCNNLKPATLNFYVTFLASIKDRRLDANRVLVANFQRMRSDLKGLCSAFRYTRTYGGIPKNTSFQEDFRTFYQICSPIVRNCRDDHCTTCPEYVCDAFTDFFNVWDDGYGRVVEYKNAISKVIDLCPDRYYFQSIKHRISGNYDLALKAASETRRKNESQETTDCLCAGLETRAYLKMIGASDSPLGIAKKCVSSFAFHHMISHSPKHKELIKDLSFCISILRQEPRYLSTFVKVTQKRCSDNSILSSLWSSALTRFHNDTSRETQISRSILEVALSESTKNGCSGHAYQDTEREVDKSFIGLPAMKFQNLTQDLKLFAESMSNFLFNGSSSCNSYYPVILFSCLASPSPVLWERDQLLVKAQMCQEALLQLGDALKYLSHKRLSFGSFFSVSGILLWQNFPLHRSVGRCKIFTIFHNFILNLKSLARGESYEDPTFFHEWKSHSPKSYFEFGQYLEIFLENIRLEIFNDGEEENVVEIRSLVSRYESVRPYFYAETAWRISALSNISDAPEAILQESRLACLLLLQSSIMRDSVIIYARNLLESFRSLHLNRAEYLNHVRGLLYLLDQTNIEVTSPAWSNNEDRNEFAAIIIFGLKEANADVALISFFHKYQLFLVEPDFLMVYLEAALSTGYFKCYEVIFESIDALFKSPALRGEHNKARLFVSILDFFRHYDPVFISSLIEKSVNIVSPRLFSFYASAYGLEIIVIEPRDPVEQTTKFEYSPFQDSSQVPDTTTVKRKIRKNRSVTAKDNTSFSLSSPLSSSSSSPLSSSSSSPLSSSSSSPLSSSPLSSSSSPSASSPHAKASIRLHSRIWHEILDNWDDEKISSFYQLLKEMSGNQQSKKVWSLFYGGSQVFRIKWYHNRISYRLLFIKEKSQVLILAAFPRNQGYPKAKHFMSSSIGQDDIFFSMQDLKLFMKDLSIA